MSAADVPPPAWTGPWADDARRILELVQGHVGGPRADGDRGERADPANSAEHPLECAYCPICQGIALVRRSGPETLDRIAELAAGLAATIRATDPGRRPPADDPGPDPDPASRPSARPSAGPSANASTGQRPDPGPGPAAGRAAPPTTVRIDVTD